MEPLLEKVRERFVVSNLSEKTVNDYIHTFKLFAIDQNINEVSDVSEDKIISYLAKKKETGLTGSVKGFTTMINKFIKVFNIEGIKVPAGHRHKRQREPEPFTKEEIQRMIDYIKAHPKDFKYGLRLITVLKFLPMVGMRGKDFEALNREQFMKGKHLTYHTSKKNKDVSIFMPKWLVDDLGDYFEAEPPKDYAFNMNKDSLRYYLKKLVNKLGIIGKNRNAFPHLLRHTMITMYHDEGVDIKDIAELVGHSDIKHTESYIKVDREKLKERVINKTRALKFV